jgi:hypothetical protein
MKAADLRKQLDEALKPTEFRSTPTERLGSFLKNLLDYLDQNEINGEIGISAELSNKILDDKFRTICQHTIDEDRASRRVSIKPEIDTPLA